MPNKVDCKKVLFRASAIGQIMTDPRSNADKSAGKLSETAKKYCRKYYREVRYGRTQEITTKYMEKGLMVEEDSLTLYSRIKKVFFKKNEEQLTNEYICGHPDTFIGPDIRHALEVNDIKSSWDVFTFPYSTDPIDDGYYWQLQAYMALTGAKIGKLSYCLINTPEVLINDEKRKLLYKMAVTTDLNPDYVTACEEVDRNMRFDDIPMEERLCEFTVSRNDEDIERMYQRVRRCRYYLEELDESYGIKPQAPEPVQSVDVNKIVLQKIQA